MTTFVLYKKHMACFTFYSYCPLVRYSFIFYSFGQARKLSIPVVHKIPFIEGNLLIFGLNWLLLPVQPKKQNILTAWYKRISNEQAVHSSPTLKWMSHHFSLDGRVVAVELAGKEGLVVDVCWRRQLLCRLQRTSDDAAVNL